jgi:hypothetical protein
MNQLKIADRACYLEEYYIRGVLANEAADGLHPFVDRHVLPRPNIVSHELDLLLAVLKNEVNFTIKIE